MLRDAQTGGEIARKAFRGMPGLMARFRAGLRLDAPPDELRKIHLLGDFSMGKDYREQLAGIHEALIAVERTEEEAVEFLLGAMGPYALSFYVSAVYSGDEYDRAVGGDLGWGRNLGGGGSEAAGRLYEAPKVNGVRISLCFNPK